jgi:hypothetical protein
MIGDGLRYSYTVTVEDVGAKIKLVPLHQSLSQGGRESVSFRSGYANIAVVCIDSEVELEAPVLQEAISAGMKRACRITAGEGSFLVRMSSEAASGERRQRAGIS